MPEEATPKQATLLATHPYLLVDDVYRSAEYYRDVLGFRFEQFWGEPPRFVMVIRDAATIMMRQPLQAPGSVHRPNSDHIEHSFDAYVRVDHVDALYREYQHSGAKLLYEPYDQPHDCREFEIEDCNGYRLCFGQDLLR